MYILLVRQMKKNQECLEQLRSKSHSNAALFAQIIFTIAARALSWIPSGIINLTILLTGRVSPHITISSIFLPSVYPVVTPALFILVVVRHRCSSYLLRAKII